MTLAQKSTEVIRHERRAGNRNIYLVLGLITFAVIALAVAFATSRDTAETAAATRTVAEVEPTSVFSQEEPIMMDLLHPHGIGRLGIHGAERSRLSGICP